MVAVATILGSGYFAVAGVLNPGGLVPGGDTAAARTFAAYLAARSSVLLGGLLWSLAVRDWRMLRLVLAFNGAVQAIDTVLGALQHDVARTVGPACFAAALLWAAYRLRSGHSVRG